MLVLSRQDIEVIGNSVLEDYDKCGIDIMRIPIDIESFARNYLGLTIEYQRLSENGSILGLTTYGGVILELALCDGLLQITVPEDTVLLDDSLAEVRSLHRRRFTLAHECAHQILARIEERKTGKNFRTSVVSGRKYSCRELHKAFDWSEWQANTLAAGLLIPKQELLKELSQWGGMRMPTVYGHYFGRRDYRLMKELTATFGVSISAMKIRLNELGRLTTKEFSDYVDPYSILPDRWGVAYET